MELTYFLGRKRYERTGGEDPNHRNGSYDRNFTLKGIGPVEVDIPRDRKGKFKTQIIARSKRYEEDLRQDLCLMFLTGVSTRSLSMISSRLIGRKLSSTEVSAANKELVEAVEQWRTRDLSKESIKYLFIDGVCFSMRIDGSVEMVSVLVVIGVTERGEKLVLALQAGDKELASNWRELFSDLKRRGLEGQRVILGVMDGLTGFPTESDPPLAEENSLDACLTFFTFPEEEWISLRTTNIIERLNKEFKRRTKPMEIIAGEQACYNLLAFICLKMELHWRSNPIGKVRHNLPFFQRLAEKNFTQNT